MIDVQYWNSYGEKNQADPYFVNNICDFPRISDRFFPKHP